MAPIATTNGEQMDTNNKTIATAAAAAVNGVNGTNGVNGGGAEDGE